MSSTQNIASVNGHHEGQQAAQQIAIYPGAFKPPHVSHVDAIRYLLEDVGVDSIVVIISNRCRIIPGTNLALDADAAALLFQLLLRKTGIALERVTIEIAPHRAVSHALSYLENADSNFEMLFCVGEEDFLSADNRFTRVTDCAKTNGVSARVKVLPVTDRNVHSSQLRSFIASGYAERDRFCEALPEALSANDKISYWTLCNSLPRPVHEIASTKISASLHRHRNWSQGALRPVDPSAVDPIFEYRDPKNQLYTVKYSGDTTGPGVYGVANRQMPAHRLPVERRVTRHLARHLPKTVFHSRIEYFDRDHRVLVLKGRPVKAWTIASELQTNHFSLDSAEFAGRSLAKLHGCPLPNTPFWGSNAADKDHWETVVIELSKRAGQVLKRTGGMILNEGLTRRYAYAVRPMALHLNFRAENLFRNDNNVGIENFECAGCFGDAAFDVGTLIADYISAGIARQSISACIAAVKQFDRAYALPVQRDDYRFPARVATYCAHRLLHRSSETESITTEEALLSCAVDLLTTVDAITDSAHLPDIASLLRGCRIAATSKYDLVNEAD